MATIMFGMSVIVALQQAVPKLQPPSEGLPYESPYLGFDWTSFAIILVSLAIITVAVIWFMARTRSYRFDPIEPAVLAAKLAAIDDADLRERIVTHLRRAPSQEPTTQEAFDQITEQARNEQISAAQKSALDSATQAG